MTKNPGYGEQCVVAGAFGLEKKNGNRIEDFTTDEYEIRRLYR